MEDDSVTKLLICESSGPSKEWLQKRKNTMRVFLIQTFLIGMEYSVFFLTSWSYINTMVKPENPKVAYTLTSSAYLFCSVLTAPVIGLVADKYRNTRVLLFICNFAVISGNVAYAIPYSIVLVVAGRFVTGVGSPVRSVIAGEVARSYSKEEVVHKMSALGFSYAFGFITGPAFNLFFTRFNVWIGTWHITNANVPGIFMAILFFLNQLYIYFSVYNLSKEYDLKANETTKLFIDQHESDNDFLREENYQSRIQNFSLNGNSTTIFRNINTCLMLILSFFYMYVVVTYDSWLPLMILNILKWTPLQLNIIAFISGILFALALLVITMKPLNIRRLYWMAVMSLISLTTLQTPFLLLEILKDNLAMVITLWCIWLLLFAGFLMLDVYLITALSLMVPSSRQVFAESTRNSFEKCGALTALLTSVFVFDWLAVFAITTSTLFFLFLVTFLIRRKTFMDPKYKNKGLK